jgi:hypothetical protein
VSTADLQIFAAAPIFRAAAFSFGGGGEIRTRGPVSETLVFKTSAIDHSATPPVLFSYSTTLAVSTLAIGLEAVVVWVTVVVVTTSFLFLLKKRR